MGQATFSGNGAYKIDVQAWLVSQSGMTSTIHWRVLVIKTGSYGYSAWGNTGSNGWADSNTGGSKNLWNDGSIEYNFQNGSNDGTFVMAEGNFYVGHRADGNAEYWVNAGLNLLQLGSASAGTGTRSLPRIQTATTPQAPSPIGLDMVGMTDMRYRFSGNSDGGSPILQWIIGYGTSPSNVQKEISSSGTSTITGLQPGTTYYFWSRGRNAIGWGPWSSRSSATTNGGAKVKVAGVWKDAVPYVRIGGVWKIAQPYVRVAGTWKKST